MFERKGIGVAAGVIIGLGLVSSPSIAEEKVLEIGKWYPTLEAGMNLTQSSYSTNWSGGDKGSIVWTAISNGTLENQLSEKVNWYNTLKLAFGHTHQQNFGQKGTRVWEKPEKSTDLIDLESIARFTLGGFVDPFASGRFESQFLDGSDPDRSLTLNPMKFKETAGIAKQFINEEERTLLSRLGFSFRQSSRKMFTNPEPDETTMSETSNDGGIEFITDYKTKVFEDRVSWTSKLSFYQPVFFSGKSDLEGVSADSLTAHGIDTDVADFTTTLEVDWENILTTQITKFISVNLYTRWIYDKYDNTVVLGGTDGDGNPIGLDAVSAAIRKAGQLKQTLSIGVTYRFL